MNNQPNLQEIHQQNHHQTSGFAHLVALFILLLMPTLSHAGVSPYDIRVNQLGYYPNSTKYAFIQTNQSLETVLGAGTFYFAVQHTNSQGQVIFDRTSTKRSAVSLAYFDGWGCSSPCKDITTGKYLYRWDFSDLQNEQTTYKVVLMKYNGGAVSGDTIIMQSPSFMIHKANMTTKYYNLANSAFKYFYFHRMGEDTTTTYLTAAEGFSPLHAHSAFHVDSHNNPYGVKCFNNWCGIGNNIIPGGTAWADAGDFGQYPVNHAFAAWQLLNLVEFPTQSSLAVYANISTGDSGQYLNAAVDSNRESKIAAEVEVGSNWMRYFNSLPASSLYPHRINNHSWGAGLSSWNPTLEQSVTAALSTDTNTGGGNTNYAKRSANVSSTAATYAVCRTTAHMARVMSKYGKSIDAGYWLGEALAAYIRATQNPLRLYPSYYASTAQTSLSIGGGPYPDADVGDDYYACAAETYLAYYQIYTMNGLYNVNTNFFKDRVTQDSHYKVINTKIGWQYVETTANLSLLVAANDLPANDIESIKANIRTAALAVNVDYPVGTKSPSYANIGLDQPMAWGSNADILNGGMLLTYAAQYPSAQQGLTPADQAKKALKAIDYVLGENAQNLSFVTGYGAYAEEDTHDRLAWWANKSPNNAPYPKGWLSGGPMGDWQSCYASGETNWDGGNNFELTSYFWLTSAGVGISTDTAYSLGFWQWGQNMSGIDMAKALSTRILNNQSLNKSTFKPNTADQIVPSRMVYSAIKTAPDGYCTKENTINWNSSLVWMAAAASKVLRWKTN